MKKLLTVTFAVLLGSGLAFAQATGGSPGRKVPVAEEENALGGKKAAYSGKPTTAAPTKLKKGGKKGKGAAAANSKVTTGGPKGSATGGAGGATTQK